MLEDPTRQTTMLASWEGVSILRGNECVWIVTESWCDPHAFSEALRLLGFAGRTDYETIYDHQTGRETFIFDGELSKSPVQAVRYPHDGRVLSGLPSSRPRPLS